MGYRIYLGSISKQKLKLIKNVTSKYELAKIIKGDSVDKDDCHCGPYDIVDEDLHSFGKYIEWTEDLRIQFSKQIFKDKVFNDDYDYDFFIINKNGLKYIIEDYAKDLVTYYKKQDMLFQLYVILNKNNPSKEEIEKFYDLVYKLEKEFYTDLMFSTYESIKENEHQLERFRDMVENEISMNFKWEISEFGNARDSIKCYNLDDNKPMNISSSWFKNKAIFNLVHIYKSFNFKKNELVIYGY